MPMTYTKHHLAAIMHKHARIHESTGELVFGTDCTYCYVMLDHGIYVIGARLMNEQLVSTVTGHKTVALDACMLPIVSSLPAGYKLYGLPEGKPLLSLPATAAEVVAFDLLCHCAISTRTDPRKVVPDTAEYCASELRQTRTEARELGAKLLRASQRRR